MLKNNWYAILDSKEVKKNKPVGVVRCGEKLVLWRNNHDEISCLYEKCCHRGVALSAGKCIDDHLECPFHGFRYDTSGKVILIPANGSNYIVPDQYHVNSFIVKEAYGFIWLWYGDQNIIIPDIPFFKELRTGYEYSTFSETWPVDYTRAIENQLDVVHLPFVHHNTIGRGNRTLINGPVVKWENDLMTFYVDNRHDDGQTPLKPNEIKDYEKLFHLQLQMPNTWQNIISDNVRIVAAFAPIDDENTHIYLRFYQNFIKLPILKSIVGELSKLSNKIILHQDRRVVATQMPKKTELKMNEKLIQGDLPIIEFRKKREQIKNTKDL